MDEEKRAIGVFDSGIGGLTVLEAMVKALPNEDYLYVADQGHCPYGTKTPEEVAECVVRVGKWLLDQNVKAIVIACNTASLQIEALRKVTDIPVISVIEPTVEAAMKKSLNKKVAVLATNGTIKIGKYQQILKDNGYEAVGVPCSEFVDFVEHHELDDPLGQKIVNAKLADLKNQNCDTLIHGCTHFSLLEDKMKKVLGDINYVACGEPTASLLQQILCQKHLLNKTQHQPYLKIYTTGSVEEAKMNMKWFKLDHEDIKSLKLD